MATLATRFVLILRDLRAVVAAHMAGDPARVPLFTFLWTRLGRMSRRFETLFTQWQAGTLPSPCPSRAGQTRRPRAPSPRLPRGSTWVVAAIGYQAAGQAGALQYLLNDPQMPDFLAAVPQAGRLLRPLCHMLGITAAHDVPAVLNLPPPPRFRPSPPPPPPYLGLIDPPEVPPRWPTAPRRAFSSVWCV